MSKRLEHQPLEPEILCLYGTDRDVGFMATFVIQPSAIHLLSCQAEQRQAADDDDDSGELAAGKPLAQEQRARDQGDDRVHAGGSGHANR